MPVMGNGEWGMFAINGGKPGMEGVGFVMGGWEVSLWSFIHWSKNCCYTFFTRSG